MVIMTQSDLPKGELDEHHLFRLKKFKHLYYCPSCKRNIDSAEPMNKCSICSGDLVELVPKTKEEIKYRYYCPVCEKNFTVPEEASKCINCGNKFIHQYELAAKTEPRMWVADIKSSLGKMLSYTRRIGKIAKTRLPKKENKQSEVKDTIEDIIIEQSNFVRPVFRLNLFSRNREELPAQ